MGTSLAAQRGILIKSSKALEAAKKIDLIVFDKTGTLTKGEPEVTKMLSLVKDEKKLLQLAASVEANSEHPLAKAIVFRAKKDRLKILPVEGFKVLPGKGIKALVLGRQVLVGTQRLLQEQGVVAGKVATKKIKAWEKEGQTVVVIAWGEETLGLIAIADTLKKHAAEAIADLHKMGKKTAIITGDNKRVARAIADKVNITRVLAQVLPQEKAQEIKKLQQQYKVSFVGDGINDAPALAQSDLGIVLSSGTDIAMETGEIILVQNDLRKVSSAIELSSFTFKKIKQNLFWAFIYNLLGIPIAAGVLYPLTGALLSPTIAAAAMAFSSVSVVTNSLLMKRYKGL